MTTVQVVLAVSSGLFFAWAGIWVLLLPALMINNADNGRFGHDLSRVWIPEFEPAAVGVVYCAVILAVGGAKPSPWTLVPLAVLVAAITIYTVVGLPLVARTGPGR